jgi:hypothetical protein
MHEVWLARDALVEIGVASGNVKRLRCAQAAQQVCEFVPYLDDVADYFVAGLVPATSTVQSLVRACDPS